VFGHFSYLMDGSVRRNYGYTKRNHWTLAPPTDGLPKMDWASRPVCI